MNTRPTIKDFTDLKVWQEAHQMVISVYKITRFFPKEELFSLTSQMRRACVSVTSNIAEGFGRVSPREKIHFYFHSQASLNEIRSQLHIAKDLSYLSIADFDDLTKKINLVHKFLHGLIRATRSRI